MSPPPPTQPLKLPPMPTLRVVQQLFVYIHTNKLKNSWKLVWSGYILCSLVAANLTAPIQMNIPVTNLAWFFHFLIEIFSNCCIFFYKTPIVFLCKKKLENMSRGSFQGLKYSRQVPMPTKLNLMQNFTTISTNRYSDKQTGRQMDKQIKTAL